MKWLIIAGFLVYLVRSGDGGVLKCPPGAQEALCSSEINDAQLEVVQREKGSFEVECLAGSEWNSNCHHCKCSSTGVAECSKQSTCDTVVSEPVWCKANTTFSRECNTCVCLDNGMGLCSIDHCTARYALMKTDLVKGKDCAPNTTWDNQCNSCACSHDGYALCTEKACVGYNNDNKMRCAPESVWRNDCNTCWCTATGQAICTRMGCSADEIDSPILRNDAPDTNLAQNATLLRKTRSAQNQEAVKACQPGAEFRVDCNKCLCDNEGSDFSCTRIDCRALNNNNNGGTDRAKRDTIQNVNMECSPGTVFEQGCSVCRCTQDGHHAVCSLRQCVQNQNSTNEAKTITPDSDSNFRCNPGEQIRQGCNDCTCAADGKGIFCSLLLCDSENIPN